MLGVDQLTRDQIACLAEPGRFDVFRVVLIRPATLTQVGAALGHHPAWVRHHVLRLVEYGLVELAEERKCGNYTEKYYRATADCFAAHVLITAGVPGEENVVVAGSHDLALEALAAMDRAPGMRTVSTGSLDGLIALRQGVADVAACHLFDPREHDYNLPHIRHLFPDEDVFVRTLVSREQGLVTAAGNPRALKDVECLSGEKVRFVNRVRGSGTRVWLDQQLHARSIDPGAIVGYEHEVLTHTEVAREIATGRADAGIAVRAVAEREDLGFVPLFTERFDLVFRADDEDGKVGHALDGIGTARFRKAVAPLAGYDTEHSGDEVKVAG